MNHIAFCSATMAPEPKIPDPLLSFTKTSTTGLMPGSILLRRNTPEDNLGVSRSYQWLYERTKADILAYIHDDVICWEFGWDARVMEEFEDPGIGVLGFGGALWHGTDDLYKTPYKLTQLARRYYFSNVDDAETHGKRFEGARDVAVLDGFCLVVRRALLDRCGGWPRSLQFHCYDYAICALARRFGYRIRLVGVRCHHLGGRTSTTPEYQKWASDQGVSDQQIHEESHRWFYQEFRDVMPARVKE